MPKCDPLIIIVVIIIIIIIIINVVVIVGLIAHFLYEQSHLFPTLHDSLTRLAAERSQLWHCCVTTLCMLFIPVVPLSPSSIIWQWCKTPESNNRSRVVKRP